MEAWVIQNYSQQEAHEVSSVSLSLQKNGFNVRIITPSEIYLDENKKPDVAIIRGTYYKDYSILKKLEKLGCVILNSVDNHYLTSDKWLKYQKLESHNIRIPKTKLISIPFDGYEIDDISWPCVVKRRYGAFGIGVYLCKNDAELYFIAKTLSRKFGDSNMLIQEYIGYSGNYISVSCIGKKMWSHIAIPPENDTEFLSYKKPGSSRHPWTIDDQLEELVNSGMMALGLDIARFDILLEETGYVICEVNSPGGFRMTEDIHKISIADELAIFMKSKI